MEEHIDGGIRFGLCVNLSDLDVLRGDVESRWIELSTADGQSITVGANIEIDYLTTLVRMTPKPVFLQRIMWASK